MKFLFVFAAIVAVGVASPRMSIWTLQELSDALQNPHTNPTVVPILEQALNDLMDALYAGQNVESIIVPLPAGIEVLPSPVVPSPVEIAPSPVDIAPSPVETAPVVPTPVEAAEVSSSSPLVQIIVNVAGQQQVADVIAPAPVVPPMPSPLPVPVPEPVIIPEPVLVQELPPVPVIVAPLPEAPIVVAPLPVNPIDVIAVNPVDTWGPNGLIPVAAGSGNEVGPM